MNQPAQLPLEKHINAHLEKIRARLPNWNGSSWDDWAPHEAAEAVRAIVRDHFDDHGFGSDWQEAARHAEFVLCAAYSDIVSVVFAGQKPSPHHNLHIRIAPANQDEAFEILLARPNEEVLPPVPSIGGAGVDPHPERVSVSGAAAARATSRFDATDLRDEPILQALDTVAAFINNKDRICLILVAAMIVRWRGCQVSQVVQGGVVYRDIQNASGGIGSARLVYARLGPRMQQALGNSGPTGNVILLIP